MIKAGTKVKLIKVGKVAHPEYDTANWSEYNEGEATNEKSPPVLYEVEGRLLSDLEKEQPVNIERYKRNGEEKYGMMRTSPVERMKRLPYNKIMVDTQNSIYEIYEYNND